MNIEAMKLHLENIDDNFSRLKRNQKDSRALHNISKELGILFKGHFVVIIIPTNTGDPLSIMSVYPEISTLNKIAESIIREEDPSIIKTLWEENDSWIIEIDRRILDDSAISLSSRELTALLLHEIGHVKDSNSIPTRISRIMKYQYAQLSSKVKAMFKSKYGKTLILPIADTASINASIRNSGVTKEMQADKYAIKFGYSPEIVSAIDKIIAVIPPNNLDGDESMQRMMIFITKSAGDLTKRRNRLVRESFKDLREYNASPYIESCFKEIMEDLYDLDPKITEENTEKILQEYEDEYFCEFFGIRKKLKPLRPYDLDYIQIEVEKIKTYGDKFSIISFIQGKIDMVDYYINILNNDKFSRKYEVPHTMEYLESYKSKLKDSLERALNTRIVPTEYGIVIRDPIGYEG